MSEEFQYAYAELLNSQMVFKQALDQFFSQQTQQFHIASQSELDDLLANQRQLKKENQRTP